MQMSKKDNKILSEKEIVRSQFLSFQQLDQYIDLVNIIGRYKESEYEIGENTEHINFRNYREQSDKLLKEEGYSILLIDDSILNMYYLFDDNQNIVKHVLSFVPSYQNDLYREDMNKTSISSEQQEQDANIPIEVFSKRISNYIRIDFDDLGRKSYYHALVHMHIGVFEYSIRFPLESAVYPNEFLFLIFKYIYHLEDDCLKKIASSYDKDVKLTADELTRFRIRYGEINYTKE